MNIKFSSCEWLQSNRFGSFAMGTADRIPRRKYHSLLCIREPGHGEPLNLLLDVGEYIEADGQLFMLNSFDFGDRVEPKGFQHLTNFEFRPVPRWSYEVGSMTIVRELQLDPERDILRLFYAFRGVTKPVRLKLRPFVLCRPMHHLTRENPFLNGGVRDEGEGVLSFQFYDGLPRTYMRASCGTQGSRFIARGEWVQGLQYRTEAERGYPSEEDSYAPGEFELTLTADSTVCFELGATPLSAPAKPRKTSAPKTFLQKLQWAGERYLVTSKQDFHSIIAGYPWFGSWGRDAFISLPGLCLTEPDEDEIKKAARILESYGELIVEGLTTTGIVCAFPEKGLIMTGLDTPLLYIHAVQRLHERGTGAGYGQFMPTVCRILNALKNGADRRVHVSPDGGLFLDHGPWAVTWMDVLLEGQPVTPRTGFAVDLNALFFNAMQFALEWARVHDPVFAKEWGPLAEQAETSFVRRFWSEERGYLADAHDGQNADFSLRPNQLWALALPYSPLSREMGERIVEAVKRELVTPVGLRTLARSDTRYRPRYAGSHRERDLAYHQGTVWPWLIGIYADALFKVGGAALVKDEIEPMLKRLELHMEEEGCLGQISEVFDGDAPHAAGGTPAQAWSVAEVLRAAQRARGTS